MFRVSNTPTIRSTQKCTTASGTGHIFCAATSLQRDQASLATLERGGCTVLICVASRWSIVDTEILHFARLLPYKTLKEKSLELTEVFTLR